MPNQEIVTISHYGGGIQIKRSGSVLNWPNVEWLAESHAVALARIERFERIEGSLATLHTQLSDAIGRSGSDGAEFLKFRDMLREVLAE